MKNKNVLFFEYGTFYLNMVCINKWNFIILCKMEEMKVYYQILKCLLYQIYYMFLSQLIVNKLLIDLFIIILFLCKANILMNLIQNLAINISNLTEVGINHYNRLNFRIEQQFKFDIQIKTVFLSYILQFRIIITNLYFSFQPIILQ